MKAGILGGFLLGRITQIGLAFTGHARILGKPDGGEGSSARESLVYD
jgi:hypothetical protein